MNTNFILPILIGVLLLISLLVYRYINVRNKRKKGVSLSANITKIKSKLSHPYVIKIVNRGTEKIDYVELLGTFRNLGKNEYWKDGSFSKDDVIISSNMPETTYHQILLQIATKPFRVGLIYVNSSTNMQILQGFRIHKFYADGHETIRPIVPAIDPYQFQNNVIGLNEEFDVDGYTSLILNCLLPGATITLNIYPIDESAEDEIMDYWINRAKIKKGKSRTSFFSKMKSLFKK